jgi:hypothetical protein
VPTPRGTFHLLRPSRIDAFCLPTAATLPIADLSAHPRASKLPDPAWLMSFRPRLLLRILQAQNLRLVDMGTFMPLFW